MVPDLRLIEHKTTESIRLLVNQKLPHSCYFSPDVNLSLMKKHFGRVFELLKKQRPNHGNRHRNKAGNVSE